MVRLLVLLTVLVSPGIGKETVILDSAERTVRVSLRPITPAKAPSREIAVMRSADLLEGWQR